MNTKYFLILFLSAFLLVSCQKESQDLTTKSQHALPAKTELNVAYGSHVQQKMDVYLPAGRTNESTKVIILIHGGAWSMGDKDDFADYIVTLKQRLPDYAIFNINYRLANGTNLFPAQEQDVQSAINFIVSKSAEYKFNATQLSLLGFSAGSHLSLLQAYKNQSPKIKAVIDFFGPTDLVDMYTNPANPMVPFGLQSVIGGTPATHPAMYFQSSPIQFVSAQSTPTLILQGGLDPLVAPAQSTALKNKLQSFGVVHSLVFYPNEGHGWTGATLADSFDKIVAFLKTTMP